jgi:arylsulfatase A
LLTGRYPIRTGLAYRTLNIGDERGLKPEETTVAEELKRLGYVTALVGKWHLGDRPEYHPLNHGFDEFFGTLYSNDEPEQSLLHGREAIETPIDAQTLALQFIEHSVSFIERNSRGSNNVPFFLMLSTTSPHKPLRPSPRFAGKSRAGGYGDVVEELDWGVGEIMSVLKENGIDENTLVIFTSDNGPFPEGSTGGLRGGKGTSWEGGYRVPFVARWPKEIEPKGISTGMAMNIDLLPTLVKLAGKNNTVQVGLDGKDISALLEGSDQSPHDVLYFFNNEKIAGLRTQQWKAIFWADYRGINRWMPDHELNMLFDMESDPGERYSLASNHKDVWEKMLEYLSLGVKDLESLALFSDKVQ